MDRVGTLNSAENPPDGGRRDLNVTLVQPGLVEEVDVDVARNP